VRAAWFALVGLLAGCNKLFDVAGQPTGGGGGGGDGGDASAGPDVITNANCPPEYNAIRDETSMYRFVSSDDMRSWYDARDSCIQDTVGLGTSKHTHLTVLGGPAEYDDVFNGLPSSAMVWVGVSAAMPMDWTWVDGETGFLEWLVASDDNLDGCGLLEANTFTEIGLAAGECLTPAAYVCECDDHAD